MSKEQALELLERHIEAGADEFLQKDPIDRFSEAKTRQTTPHQKPTLTPIKTPPPLIDTTAQKEADELAKNCKSIDDLYKALCGFKGCALSKMAKNTVFADGNQNADIMLIGEAPGREEDRKGLPFVGESGRLMDEMMKYIGLTREQVYITNTVFWRPAGNRAPRPDEIALCKPFIERHIELMAPKFLICIGNIATKNILGQTQGITQLRGNWFPYEKHAIKIEAMAMLHPAYLLRQPLRKEEAWQDWLRFGERLEKKH